MWEDRGAISGGINISISFWGNLTYGHVISGGETFRILRDM